MNLSVPSRVRKNTRRRREAVIRCGCRLHGDSAQNSPLADGKGDITVGEVSPLSLYIGMDTLRSLLFYCIASAVEGNLPASLSE